jgi:DNA-binding MarR family transcriptional regulator
MAAPSPSGVENLLNDFAEKMTGLMLDQYQQQIAELDLTIPQAQALRILRRGALTPGHLAEELGMSAPALTQLTDRLDRKGLIERKPAEGDRRCVIVALTARGKRLIDEFRARREKVFSGALAHLSEPEQEQIYKAMSVVTEALEASRRGATAGRTEVSKLPGKTFKA